MERSAGRCATELHEAGYRPPNDEDRAPPTPVPGLPNGGTSDKGTDAENGLDWTMHKKILRLPNLGKDLCQGMARLWQAGICTEHNLGGAKSALWRPHWRM